MSSSDDQLCRPGVVKVRGSSPQNVPPSFPPEGFKQGKNDLALPSGQDPACNRLVTCVGTSWAKVIVFILHFYLTMFSKLLCHSTFCYPEPPEQLFTSIFRHDVDNLSAN